MGHAKVGSQETPGGTGKFGLGVQNETGQRLIEFCQENTLVIENTLFQQHKRRLYTWTSPDGQHQNQIDYIFCSPYDYTVEVRYRFKGLDLINRVPDELWMEVCDTTGDKIQDHPQEK